MKLRGGSVLGKKTILKSDHFPGCQNKRLSPQIDGAPNYRQVFSPFLLGKIFLDILLLFPFDLFIYFVSISLLDSLIVIVFLR